MTKMTKKDYFNTLLTLDAVKADKALTDFIEHELDLLTRKNSGEKKPTKTQEANETLKDAIIMGLDADQKYTITDVIKTVPECADLSNQKVSQLCRQLVKEGRMERSEDKRKAYFTIVTEDGEDA